MASKVSEEYNSARNKKEFGSCGGSAVVSSQFLNKHHKNNPKFDGLPSLMYIIFEINIAKPLNT